MKMIITLFLLVMTAQSFADEVRTISCTDEAQEITLGDLTSMVRNKAGFETGDLSLEKNDSGEFKNMILLKKFDEEKNEVTYQATIAGTITNQANGKSVFTIDQCEVRFDADTCSVKSQFCSGI